MEKSAPFATTEHLRGSDQFGQYFWPFQGQEIENSLPQIWALFKNAYCGTEWYRLLFLFDGYFENTYN